MKLGFEKTREESYRRGRDHRYEDSDALSLVGERGKAYRLRVKRTHKLINNATGEVLSTDIKDFDFYVPKSAIIRVSDKAIEVEDWGLRDKSLLKSFAI